MNFYGKINSGGIGKIRYPTGVGIFIEVEPAGNRFLIVCSENCFDLCGILAVFLNIDYVAYFKEVRRDIYSALDIAKPRR